MSNHSWMGRVAIATIIRRLTYIALALVLGYFGVGKAHAQSDSPVCNAGTATCGQGEAYVQVIIEANARICTGSGFVNKGTGAKGEVYGSDRYLGKAQCFRQSDNATAWEANTTGFFARSCLSKNADVNIKNEPVIRAWNKHCVGGCTFAILAGGKRLDSQQISSGSKGTLWSGVFEYTGEVCYGDKFGINLAVAESPAPSTDTRDPLRPPEQECVPAGAGQTFCMKPDGKQCHTASTGRQICWSPTETGEKTDGDATQRREAGLPATPTPPTAPPPPGTTWSPGERSTSTNRTNGVGGGTAGTTHTITTNRTSNGAPAGTGTNSGEPGGVPNGVPGGSQGDTGTAAGGSTCSTPPITSGKAIEGMIATQAWATRCAVQAGNALVVTGDIGNCDAAFSVTGDETQNANVQKMKAMRDQICPGGAAAAAGDGNVSDDGLGGDDGNGNGFVQEGEEIGGDLDDEGLGFSRSCPTMPSVSVFGTTVQFDNSVMCDWLELGGQFVLLLAALASIRILSGGVA